MNNSNQRIDNETEEWLKENSVDYDIRFDGYFDFIKFSNLNGSYYKWELTLKRGVVKHKFNYYTHALGINKYGDVERPNIANLLCTVVNRCYDVSSFSSYKEWSSNYGIEHSQEVEESFYTLVKDFKALNDIFGSEKLDELFDIVMYYS